MKLKKYTHLSDNTKLGKSDKIFNCLCAKQNNSANMGYYIMKFQQTNKWYLNLDVLIRGKPVRLVFKIYCAASFDGFVYRFYVYEGKNYEVDDNCGLELVLCSLLKVIKQKNHEIFFHTFLVQQFQFNELANRN